MNLKKKNAGVLKREAPGKCPRLRSAKDSSNNKSFFAGSTDGLGEPSTP